jgi:phosphoribosyl 1,2-cyclic phosphodiesterase
MTVEVTFWGTRGSFPCASLNHMKYGGNTSCVSVDTGNTTIVLDAGTGLFMLGKHLVKRGVQSATLLLSHSHTDHIIGFPFFAPAWVGSFALTIMAGHLSDNGGVRDIFEVSMRDPVFPVKLTDMGGATRFHDFHAGESFSIGTDVTVRTASLNHPNGATAYRIEAEGKAVCYVTDTEHVPGKPDQNVLNMIRGADLVIYDSTYTDDEFPSKIGWGHSTWQEGIRLCRAAGVRRLAIFHHDPDHMDDFMDQVDEDARHTWDHAFVAREGMVIPL